MATDDDIQGVVLDSGSKYMKAGFAGESSPRCVLPNVIGRFRHEGLLDGFPEVYFGNEAITRRGISNLTWPVKDGLVANWDELEKLWHHVFYTGLHIPPETTKVLHSVHPEVPRGVRERMAEILFESFAVHSVYLVRSPVLVLHASGRTSGLVYENGSSCSYIAPIFEGYPLLHSIIQHSITGEALSNRLCKLLNAIGYSFTTPAERDLIDRIKSEVCYVARNYDEELKMYAHSSHNNTSFELPDGQKINLTKERFECTEAMFNPSLQGSNEPGVVEAISNSIDKCDIDYKPIFYGNIVLAGGSTMFPGMCERVLADVTKKVKFIPRITAKLDELPARNLAAWTGGSILASLDCAKGFWMTRRDYQDIGADHVNYKFF